MFDFFGNGGQTEAVASRHRPIDGVPPAQSASNIGACLHFHKHGSLANRQASIRFLPYLYTMSTAGKKTVSAHEYLEYLEHRSRSSYIKE
jgi:hypothetical protein